MAEINPEPPLEERKFLLERAKFFREHVQSVLNLAAGSLVLSVTFLHDRAGAARGAEYLRVSWFLLIIAIVLGLGYNYVLSITTKQVGDRYKKLLYFTSAAFHLTFLAAMVYLAKFGLNNI